MSDVDCRTATAMRLFSFAAAWALLAGCASGGAMTGSGSISAPQNYRQLIAAKLRQWEDVPTIRSAEISKPHQKFVGLIYGGTRPTVCVKLGQPNLIGMPSTFYYVFYFSDGQVDGYKQGAVMPEQVPLIGCGDQPLTKFTELARAG